MVQLINGNLVMCMYCPFSYSNNSRRVMWIAQTSSRKEIASTSYLFEFGPRNSYTVPLNKTHTWALLSEDVGDFSSLILFHFLANWFLQTVCCDRKVVVEMILLDFFSWSVFTDPVYQSLSDCVAYMPSRYNDFVSTRLFIFYVCNRFAVTHSKIALCKMKKKSNWNKNFVGICGCPIIIDMDLAENKSYHNNAL